MSATHRGGGEWVLLGVTALWGSTFLVIADSLASWDVAALMTMRFGLGALCLCPGLYACLTQPALLRAAAALALFAGAGFGLQTAALQYTSQAHCAFGSALVTVFVPGLTALLTRTPWRRRTGLAIVCALGGMGLLLGESLWGAGGAVGTSFVKGDVLAVLAAVAFAGQIYLLEQWSRSLPMLPLVAGQLAGVALLSGVAMLVRGAALAPFTALGFGRVAYLGVFGTAVALAGQAYGQARTSATKAAFIYALEPVFATALAYLVRGQRLSGHELLGGALVVVSAALADATPTAPRDGAAKKH